MKKQPIVLVTSATITCQTILSNEPIKLIHVKTGTAALKTLQTTIPDIILLDLHLSDMDGMDILRNIHQRQLNSTIIVINVGNSYKMMTEAMHYGVFDFMEKPFQANRLIVTIRNALYHRKLSQLVDDYDRKNKRYTYHRFIGASETMQTIYRVIDNVATSKASVFITGESGTGKELCAEALHKESRRKDKPFIVINCAVIASNLMESELFGHVKGSFTGANKNRLGAASLADGGTLFLDEIGDMDMDLQRKLLRFVQTGTFQKVGSNQLEKVNIRFICATHHDPVAAIKAKHFREDLYYRLNVIAIKMPALRIREDDVLLLAQHFLKYYAQEENKAFVSLAPETETLLKQYDWPGNVRQLQNVIHNIVLLNEAQVVTPTMFLSTPIKDLLTRHSNISSSHHSIRKQATSFNANPTQDLSHIRPLWQAEKELIETAIEACQGNIPKAAFLLEINASTIYRKLRKWEKNKIR